MTAEAPVFPEEALTRDAYLGGRVTLLQPRAGYRAGVDPVLLAAAVPARPGERVLELGCGAGAALFCLGRRVGGLALNGVERQADYAELAWRNAEENGLGARIVTADLTALPPEIRGESFDHVLANPPYFDPEGRTRARDPGREAALAEETPLAAWISTGARRLAPGGRFTMIHRAERLPELLAAAAEHLGSLELQPLAPRAGRSARLVILRGRKGGRAAFRMHAPIVLHAGPRHEADGEDYAPAIRAVLREGAALDFGVGA
ncbi:tRNA1(Val) (adenine(37)-N6)-methyltransferase [Roseivivax sp.]